MKNIFYTLLILNLSVFVGTLKAQEKLNNQSIIEMVELGLDENIIKSKINSSDVNFDTDLESLKVMKSKGVSSELMSLMIEKSAHKTKIQSGIYYVLAKERHKIDPNVSNNQNLNTTNWWFQTASSPQEFVLIRMKKNLRKNRREVVVGKFGLASGGGETGVNSENTVAFKSEEIGNGTYKVVPTSKLLPGDYCFFYKGRIPVGGYTNQSVFDFSVE